MILIKAELYVRQLFEEQLPEWMFFHNLEHTEMVVQACDEISRGLKLKAEDREIILLAAWFHDIGYLNTYFGHEKEGQEIARKFLSEKRYDNIKTDKVVQCIAATQPEYEVQNIRERVIRDADFYHLSHNNYFELLDRLRKEWELKFGSKIPDGQWHLRNLNFLHEHRYCTSYAQKKLTKGKAQNIKKNIKVLEDLNHGI